MNELTVEEKFAKVIVDLRMLKPLCFYSALWETIKKESSESIDSIGVTTNKLLYNESFVDMRDYKEFLFIVLHEITHIALMHVARRKKRDSQLWNIAVDLYTNATLLHDIKHTSHGGKVLEMVKIPNDMTYTETLDIQTEFVEDIYDNLYNQAKYNGYLTGIPNNANGTYHFEYSGKIPGRPYIVDLTSTSNTGGDVLDSNDDENQQINDSKQIISEAKTRYDLKESGKDIGTVGNHLLTLVNQILESKIDWRRLLRKYCIQYISKDTSYRVPDKRMYYQTAIYPGQSSESDNILKDVKICIDTSGSMSETDLAYVMGQVKSLMDSYKTKAEVICWDTEVESTFELDNSIENIKMNKSYSLWGRGGTNPECLFKYFESSECKVKPFVTIVFTDAYFGNIRLTPKQSRLYKNTIWVMTREYNASFKPPVGKIAYATFSRERR